MKRFTIILFAFLAALTEASAQTTIISDVERFVIEETKKGSMFPKLRENRDPKIYKDAAWKDVVFTFSYPLDEEKAFDPVIKPFDRLTSGEYLKMRKAIKQFDCECRGETDSLAIRFAKNGNTYTISCILRNVKDINEQRAFNIQMKHEDGRITGFVNTITSNPELLQLVMPDDTMKVGSPEAEMALQNKIKGMSESVKRAVPNGNIESSTDFLQRFSMLRSTFLESVSKTQSPTDAALVNGVAVSLIDLCKKHASLLSIDEIMTCAVGVDSMIEACKDKYINSLLGIARQELEYQ